MKKLFLSLLLIFISPAVFAQERVDNQIFLIPATDYDNHGAKVSQFLKEQSLRKSNKMPVGIVHLSIVHPDFLEPNQFGLMFQKANSETGCATYKQFEYEANYIEHFYLDINLKHYRRGLNETKNPQFDCDKSSKVISALVILDTNDLAKKKIRQIRFGNGNVRDSYDVDITPNSVRLTPLSMIAFKAMGLTGPDNNYIEYHFADKKLLTLQVPMVRESEDITEAIRKLAAEHSLEPVLERKGLDTSQNNLFYFTDPSGKTLEQIGKDGYMEFGTINVTRPYDGANGRVGLAVPLRVFLTKPNVTL